MTNYYEVYKDDKPQAEGTHKGEDGAGALYDPDTIFSWIEPGVICYNDTQETSGAVTATTSNTVVATGVTWNSGDTYSIYKTGTKDSFISRICVGKIYGEKLEWGEVEEEDIPNENERW